MESPVLTTMVVLYDMGVRLDTTKLVYELPLTDGIIKIEKQGILKRGESKKDRIRHRKVVPPPKRTTGFGHNSITLVLLSKGDGTLPEKEITVKIFQNGVFHITGVLDESHDHDAVTRLQAHITNHCSDSVLSGTWTIANRRVILANYKTNLTRIPPSLLTIIRKHDKEEEGLSREKLYQSVKKQGYKTNYEPGVYPAVKIYFPNTRWIAKVFSTGNIILTGMKSKEECVDLAKHLETLLAQTG